MEANAVQLASPPHITTSLPALPVSPPPATTTSSFRPSSSSSSPESPESPQCRPAPPSPTLTRSRLSAPGHLPFPPSTLLSLQTGEPSHPALPHSQSTTSHSSQSLQLPPLSPSTPRSAPHTPPSPVHRPIPLPPVTPYDTPLHTTASSPMFGPSGTGAQSPREVSPLRWGPAGGEHTRGSSLLHIAEPLHNSPPSHTPQASGAAPEEEAADELMTTDETAPTDAPPAYTRTPGPSDLPQTAPPPFYPPPTTLTPLPPNLLALPPSHRPLDPPPECFSSPGPWRIKPRDFAPFKLRTLGQSLHTGWQALYAPALEAHGLTPSDWARFLADLTLTARLAQAGSSALQPQRPPPPVIRALLAGPRAVEGGPYDQAFRRGEVEDVRLLVGVWNESALERRRVRCEVLPAAGGGGWELCVEAI